jgi:hypothetical protein
MFYSQLLQKYPLTTKSLTSGLLFLIGDGVTQLGNYYNNVSNRKKKVIWF